MNIIIAFIIHGLIVVAGILVAAFITSSAINSAAAKAEKKDNSNVNVTI